MSHPYHPSKNGETADDRSKYPSSEGHLWFRQQVGNRPGAIGREVGGKRQCGISRVDIGGGGESQEQQKEEITSSGQQQNSNRERRKAFRAAPVDEEDYPEENNA